MKIWEIKQVNVRESEKKNDWLNDSMSALTEMNEN